LFTLKHSSFLELEQLTLARTIQVLGRQAILSLREYNNLYAWDTENNPLWA